MRFTHLIIILFTTAIVSGCVATSDDMKGTYARMARLEQEIDVQNKKINALNSRVNRLASGGANSTETKRLKARIARLEQAYQHLIAKSGQSRTVGPGNGRTGQTRTFGAVEPNYQRSLYSDAYKALSNGNYPLARELFQRYIKENPGAVELPDSFFWISESYYREGKYEESILEYQSFIDSYPRDKRVPTAYYKQGLSLVNIQRKEEAKLFLQTLIDRFPRSQESKLAKEKLRELALEQQ